MKIHTTNYINTFIEVSEDCPVNRGEIPPKSNDKSVADLQFDLISKNPYIFTSDDALFQVHAKRNDLKNTEYAKARTEFFSKGQPCFRSSPLAKRYGWGVHSNEEGKIALYGVETDEYKKFAADDKLKVVKAMRTKRKQ